MPALIPARAAWINAMWGVPRHGAFAFEAIPDEHVAPWSLALAWTVVVAPPAHGLRVAVVPPTLPALAWAVCPTDCVSAWVAAEKAPAHDARNAVLGTLVSWVPPEAAMTFDRVYRLDPIGDGRVDMGAFAALVAPGGLLVAAWTGPDQPDPGLERVTPSDDEPNRHGLRVAAWRRS